MSLVCKYCSKVFEKAATCKRHQYYCFHKQNQPRTTRKRSCTMCIRAKTRCDHRTPSCGRCLAKHRSCEYEGREPDSSKDKTETSLSLSPNPSFSLPEIVVQSSANEKIAFSFESFFDTPELDLSPAPTMATNGHALRLLSPIFGRKLGTSPIVEMFVLALKSVLYTFWQHQRCVPFIHTGQPQDLSLTNCRALVRRFFSSSSKEDTWQAIRLEHERIWFSHEEMQGWELLSALQALFIYCLLRACHGSASDLDLPLVVSVKEVSMHIGRIYAWQTQVEPSAFRGASYERWKFMETWARTITMFRLMWLVWDLSDLGPCQDNSGFQIIPLPISDVLWEAQSAEVWQPLFVQRENAVHGFTYNGVLVKLKCNGRGLCWSEPSWETWIAEVGEMGMFCGMAAQLVKSVSDGGSPSGSKLKYSVEDEKSENYRYIQGLLMGRA